jgi:hypothetical protein
MNTANTSTALLRKTLTLARPRPPGTNIFHFVWSPSRRRPRHRHVSREAAIAECERLAQLNPGTEFVVYEARSVARHKVRS